MSEDSSELLRTISGQVGNSIKGGRVEFMLSGKIISPCSQFKFMNTAEPYARGPDLGELHNLAAQRSIKETGQLLPLSIVLPYHTKSSILNTTVTP